MEKLITKFNITKQFYLFTGVVCIGLIGVESAIYFGGLGIKATSGLCLILVLLTLGVAHYLGKLNGKRAELIVHGLHAMSQGNLTHKVNITGKDEFAWMCWEYSEARKGFTSVRRQNLLDR